MTKTIPILAIVVLAVGMQSAYACAPEDVQHWNKMVWTGSPLIHPTLPDLEAGPFEVVVQIDPNAVHDVEQLVADKLNSLGYTQLDGSPVTIGNIGNVLVTYSTICGDFDINQVIGGLLIQPDSATLVLAYGIANAIWLVPSVAGIGIAMYLVKNRWNR